MSVIILSSKKYYILKNCSSGKTFSSGKFFSWPTFQQTLTQFWIKVTSHSLLERQINWRYLVWKIETLTTTTFADRSPSAYLFYGSRKKQIKEDKLTEDNWLLGRRQEEDDAYTGMLECSCCWSLPRSPECSRSGQPKHYESERKCYKSLCSITVQT